MNPNPKIPPVRKVARFGGRGDKLARRLLAEFPRWTVARTSRGHMRLQGPAGKSIFIPGTSSDWRMLRNARAQLRRADKTQ